VESLNAARHPQRAEGEAALIRKCREGDRACFDALVGRYASRVYNLALRITGHSQDAEDAAQEAFVRAFRSMRKFRFQCEFSTWLYRIAVNASLDELKRRKRRPAPFSTLRRDEDDADPQYPSQEPDAHEAFQQRQRQEVIVKALNALPPHYRIVLTLYDVEGHSYEEIAAIIGAPVGTVKSRLNRARLALRALLAPQLELLR
jgi:RNA polymerase sigma-70 factor (ECF subfamily)